MANQQQICLLCYFEQKHEFVKLIIAVFEGMNGWDFIAADSRQNIFELTQDKDRTLDCLNLAVKTFSSAPKSKRSTNIKLCRDDICLL